jgi:hypothetical protein
MEQIGRSIRRTEDDRLLRGQGRFLADIRPPGTLETVFLRSTQAHAVIRHVEVSAARAMPGVVAVFTAADVVERTQPLCMSNEVPIPERLPRELKLLNRAHPIPLLPSLKVSYVGQGITRFRSRPAFPPCYSITSRACHRATPSVSRGSAKAAQSERLQQLQTQSKTRCGRSP